jgi:hypothetical protein
MTVSPEPLAWTCRFEPLAWTCRFEPGGDLDGLQVEPPWFAVYEVRLARGLAKTFAEGNAGADRFDEAGRPTARFIHDLARAIVAVDEAVAAVIDGNARTPRVGVRVPPRTLPKAHVQAIYRARGPTRGPAAPSRLQTIAGFAMMRSNCCQSGCRGSG